MRIWIPGDDALIDMGGDRFITETRRVKYFMVDANLINNWAGLQLDDMKEINAFVSSNTDYQRLSDGPSFSPWRAGAGAVVAALPEFVKSGNIGWAEAGWATAGALVSFGMDIAENRTATQAAETSMRTNYNSISGYEEIVPAGNARVYQSYVTPVYPSGFYGVPGF
jgi:hypothetical protein